MQTLFNTFLPAIAILYLFASLVFTIAEFKHNIDKIPKVLILKLGKSVAILALFLIQMHLLFDDTRTFKFYTYVMFIINGVFIIFESLSSSKLILSYLKYTEHKFENLDKFNPYAKRISNKILKCNNLIFICSNLALTAFTISCLVMGLINFSFYQLTGFLIALTIGYFKILIYKYIKTF